MLVFWISLSFERQVIAFDIGSSASRIYLYNYSNPYQISTFRSEGYFLSNGNFEPVYKSVKPPISDCYNDEACVNQSIAPLLEYVLPLIENPADTPILLYGTSSLRGLAKYKQDDILETAFNLSCTNFSFDCQRSDFRVIEGYEEAIFAWISVNQILSGYEDEENEIPIFEMGGSSAQIAFSRRQCYTRKIFI